MAEYAVKSKKINDGAKIYAEIKFKENTKSTAKIAKIVDENYNNIVEEVAKQQGIDKSQLKNPTYSFLDKFVGYDFIFYFEVEQ